MALKICFDNQTHRIANHPVDFISLLQKIIEIFGNQLPQHWTLQYLDCDDDKVMLSSQEDYKALLEEEIGTSSKSVKIFIETLSENQSNASLSSVIESFKKEDAVVEKPVAILQAKEDVVQEQIVIPEPIVEQAETKNKEFRDAVIKIILEQLPVIASFTKDLLQEKKPVSEPEEQAPIVENTSVHRNVECDGCGVHPMVGIRYKCHTCSNFDYCEKCEATKEHPHPFVKLKKPEPADEAPQYIRGKGPFFGRGFPPLGNGLVYQPNRRSQPEAQPQAEVKPEEPVVVVDTKVQEIVVEEVKPEPEEIKKEEVVIEEIKPESEEIKKEEVQEVIKEKKEYDAKTVEKAGKLKEMFADLDLENVLEFISQVPDMSLEELIDCYKQL